MSQRTSVRTTTTTRVLALSGVSILSGLTLLATGGAAQAANSSQKAYIVPPTGRNDSTASVQLPINACPDGSQGFAAVVTGPGFPSDGQLIKGSGGLTEISDTGGLYQLQFSFRDVASDAGTTLVPGDSYDVNTFCQGEFSVPVGDTYVATFTAVTSGDDGTYSAETPPVTPPPTTPPPTTPPPTTPPVTTPPPTTPPVTTPPAPTPYAKQIALSNASGDRLAANPEVTLGQQLTIKAGGFVPGETVTLTFLPKTETGSPQVTADALAADRLTADALPADPVTADGVGNVDSAFTVPSDSAAGAYVLSLAGADQTLTSDVRVLAAGATPTPTPVPGTSAATASTGGGGGLPRTGAAIAGVSLLGAGLTGGGAALVIAGRRRRARLPAV